jgi:hypothetical protein
MLPLLELRHSGKRTGATDMAEPQPQHHLRLPSRSCSGALSREQTSPPQERQPGELSTRYISDLLLQRAAAAAMPLLTVATKAGAAPAVPLLTKETAAGAAAVMKTTAAAATTSQEDGVLREIGNGESPPGYGQTGGQDGNPPSPHSQHEVHSVQYPDYY